MAHTTRCALTLLNANISLNLTPADNVIFEQVSSSAMDLFIPSFKHWILSSIDVGLFWSLFARLENSLFHLFVENSWMQKSLARK